MRTWIIPALGLLLGGCSLPTSGDSPVPLTWRGDFTRGESTPGHITLLFDEVGTNVSGTMYYEAADHGDDVPRATYRIEGTLDEGTISFKQVEILQADPLVHGGSWCLGSYDLALAQPTESPAGSTADSPAASREPGSPALSGAYSSGAGCSGATALQPAETL